jgi:hypothetical protein
MFQRFPMRTVRVSPWVFFVWLVTVIVAGVLLVLSADGGSIR